MIKCFMEFTRQVSSYDEFNSIFAKEHQILMQDQIKLLDLFSRIEDTVLTHRIKMRDGEVCLNSGDNASFAGETTKR